MLRSSRPIASSMAPDPASADRISDMASPGPECWRLSRAVVPPVRVPAHWLSPVAIATRALRIWPRIRPAMSPHGWRVELVACRLGDSQVTRSKCQFASSQAGAGPSCREPRRCRLRRTRQRLRLDLRRLPTAGMPRWRLHSARAMKGTLALHPRSERLRPFARVWQGCSPCRPRLPRARRPAIRGAPSRPLQLSRGFSASSRSPAHSSASARFSSVMARYQWRPFIALDVAQVPASDRRRLEVALLRKFPDQEEGVRDRGLRGCTG